MEISCPYFSSKLFTETNILTFKQFISVSCKMCQMDVAENYALSFAYHKYKTLISFKIYVVLYQYRSIQFKKYEVLNDNSSESVIAKSSKFGKKCVGWTIFNFAHSTRLLIVLTLVIY